MLGSGALLAACALNAFGAYDVLSATVSHPRPSLERVVYEVEVDRQPLNRFAITHVSDRAGGRKGPLLLLSPFLLPGEFYEISETGQYAKSAAGELAQAGFDVWLVDQRRTHLPAGSCEAGTDCSAMKHWNFDAYAEDALFATNLLKSFNPHKRPVVGGFSAGSNAALATVNRAPAEFAGLFLYEGTFFTEDPAIAAHNDGNCSVLEGALASGASFDTSTPILGEVLRLAQSSPSAPSPLPFFPPGTTNEQSMLFVFGSPPPPGALSPTAGFIRSIVDFGAQRFVFTNEQRLELVGPLFDNYASLAALRDLSCGLAGRDDTYYRNVSQFHGDLLVFVEGTGFGQAMFDTVSLFEHARKISIDSHPELGESDPYFGFRWQHTFLEPLQEWLERTL
jgi:pimeloyl-ACP methyl ester carboxylesterase